MTGAQDVAASARETIESEIALHMNAIALHANAVVELKGRLNKLAPISKLPSEVLSEIFVLLAVESYHESHRYEYDWSQSWSYEWITISHICRAWRTVALDTPRIWSRIVYTRGWSKAMIEIIARSKMAPLWVKVYLPSHEDDTPVLDTLIASTPRFKELSVTGARHFVQDRLLKWREPADQLETLVLTDGPDDPAYSAWYPPEPVPASLFGGHYPNLRHLAIKHYGFPWEHPVFSMPLTTLRYVSLQTYAEQSGTFGQFLTAMENMSTLQVLELADAVPSSSDQMSTTNEKTHRTVSLPHLRSLSLASSIAICTNVLKHLTIPPVQLSIQTTTSGSDAGIMDFVQVLDEYLSRNAAPIRRVNLSPLAKVEGWQSTVVPPPGHDVPPDFRFSLEPETPLLHARELLGLMMSTSLSPHVEHLDISWRSNSEWNWTEFFKHTPELRTLGLTGRPDPDFLSALSVVPLGGERVDGDDEVRNGSLYAPKLSTVHLMKAKVGNLDDDDPSPFLVDVLKWLDARSAHNVPVHQLVMSNCINMKKAHKVLLEEHVSEVVWDGVEGICDHLFLWDEEYESEDDFGAHADWDGMDSSDDDDNDDVWDPMFW